MELHLTTIDEGINPSLLVLVVDDNKMNQSLMKHMLLQCNASFCMVSNGVEALNELKLRSFDLIFMDIQMPKMDGYTATRYIRDELKMDIPIIGMTAHATAEERKKCMGNGMNEYISKPVNEDLLSKLIWRFVAANPNVKLIDLSYMKDVSKGNLDYERAVTGQFIRSIPDDLAGLFGAFKNENVVDLRRIAHNMKTSVAIMGLLPLLNGLLDQLEDAAGIGPDLMSVLKQIEETCLTAVEEAKEFQLSLGKRTI